MDSLGALGAFVQAADSNGFTEAGRRLGVSPSAVSKAVGRLEERLGVRLFHRSTRTIALTAEGSRFLERCRRILCEVEAAEAELTQTQAEPQGRLRVSLPSMGILFMPKFADFKRRYPLMEVELDFSDRLVDVIDEGFDAVIRTGDPADSRLMVRKFGSFRRVLVASPAYLELHGRPSRPEDLIDHACLIFRYATTGKLDRWPLHRDGELLAIDLPTTVVMNTLEPQICLAEHGLGIACIPDLAIHRQLQAGTLVTVLDDCMPVTIGLSVLCPASRQLSPKLRVFVDFAAECLLEA
ncbi:MAG: LysR family transcriptional regulator [Rhizobiales bacterium]|nr:LysR family transcriptional regulator [Hyphomicrobiales bacterium]